VLALGVLELKPYNTVKFKKRVKLLIYGLKILHEDTLTNEIRFYGCFTDTNTVENVGFMRKNRKP